MLSPTQTPNYPVGPQPKMQMLSNSAAAAADELALAVLNPDGARVITAGEDPDEFNALVKGITEFWKPRDIIEQIYLTDFISAQWELQRLRRLAPAALMAGRPFAVAELQGLQELFMESAFPTGRYKSILAQFAAQGHTSDTMDAHVALRHAPAFESFERRAAVLEARRDGALEKRDRHRAGMKTISLAALPKGDADE